jgi:hypothetical protein
VVSLRLIVTRGPLKIRKLKSYREKKEKKHSQNITAKMAYLKSNFTPAQCRSFNLEAKLSGFSPMNLDTSVLNKMCIFSQGIILSPLLLVNVTSKRYFLCRLAFGVSNHAGIV